MRSAAAFLLMLAAVPVLAAAQTPGRHPCISGGPVAAPPPLLIVAGPPYDLSCTGRDVLIRGDGLTVVLRGGCRSVTVEGRFDRITAELLPGAAVAIGGAAVLLNYVLVDRGAAPVVRTTEPGLQAKQIQHFSGTQLALPTSRPGY